MNNEELAKKANFLRNEVLDLVFRVKKGHLGGDFSETDFLTVLLYDNILRFNPKNPRWEDRDRLIISKGHACAPLYIALQDLGYYSDSSAFAPDGDPFEYPITLTPGIELNTGSLGHGLGVGVGMALAGKMNKKDYNVVVILGDGECYEGSNWESGFFAAHHKLNNLIAIVDKNNQMVLDNTEECNKLEPMDKKWESFGWEVRRIDGHNFDDIKKAFRDFRNRVTDKPLIIVADTIKGKGVSFMEKNISFHHSVPTLEEYQHAKEELRRP